MGRDWNGPRDKGPPIEERERCCKKRGGKKPFVLQIRYIGPKKTWLIKYWEQKRAWHTHARYRTERARDEALRALQHRSTQYEYRIPPKE